MIQWLVVLAATENVSGIIDGTRTAGLGENILSDRRADEFTYVRI